MNIAATPSAVPFLVLGDKRRNELLARIGASVEKWIAAYGRSSNNPRCSTDLRTVELAAQSAELSAADNIVVCGMLKGVEQFAVIASADIFGAVLSLPASVSAIANIGGEIADAVRNESLLALSEALVAGVQQGAWQMTPSEPRLLREKIADTYRRGWNISVRFGSRHERLDFLLTTTLVSQLVHATNAQSSAALSRRRSAIAEELVHVEAVLGEASVSIGDLASLAVDDVIVLQNDTSQPGYLLTSTGRRVANISLGRVGTKRAAMIAK